MANPQKENGHTEYLEDGYIKLSRRIFKSKTFNGLNAIQKYIAIHFILMANWKDNEWWDSFQKKFITIKRGSFITSVENIRKDIKDKLVTTKKIRTCMELLENMQFLAREKANQYTHITVINYDLYQSDGNYRASKKARRGQGEGKARARRGQQLNKVNKDKKDKKERKKEYIERIFLTENEYQKLITELGELLTKEYMKDLSLYIQSKGKKYKSHYATILTWHRKDIKEGKNREPKMAIEESLAKMEMNENE